MNFLFVRQSDCDQLPVVKLVVTQLPEPFFLAQALEIRKKYSNWTWSFLPEWGYFFSIIEIVASTWFHYSYPNWFHFISILTLKKLLSWFKTYAFNLPSDWLEHHLLCSDWFNFETVLSLFILRCYQKGMISKSFKASRFSFWSIKLLVDHLITLNFIRHIIWLILYDLNLTRGYLWTKTKTSRWANANRRV